MRWISIKYTLLVFTLFLGLLSIAQSFTASVNLNTVTVGQQFKLTYTLTGNGSNFRHAGFPDFRVLAGPQQQQSHQLAPYQSKLGTLHGKTPQIHWHRTGKLTQN